MTGHINCSCPLCVPMKYQITPYVAPTLPMNTCGKCGSTYSQNTFHSCDSSGGKRFGNGHNHNEFVAGIAYEYAKDARYREMIRALAEQYPNIPLAEIIKDLLAGRGAS